MTLACVEKVYGKLQASILDNEEIKIIDGEGLTVIQLQNYIKEYFPDVKFETSSWRLNQELHDIKKRRFEKECARQLALFRSTEVDQTLNNQLLYGLQILVKYEDVLTVEYEDQFLEVSFFENIKKMSDEDIIMLAKLGWKESDSWINRFLIER
jgi:hypothetical protein